MPPKFIPPLSTLSLTTEKQAGDRAEHKVLTALNSMDSRWVVFHGFEWRNLGDRGEQIGEADMVLFNPNFGILVIEVKSGGVVCRSGRWFYQSYDEGGGLIEMKQSPFSQARRNRFAIREKLSRSLLGTEFLNSVGFTHSAWFPDIEWHSASIPAEIPAGSFILDKRHLKQPEKHLQKILNAATPQPAKWSKKQESLLLQVLAPELNLLVPLGTTLADIREQMYRMTQSQLYVARMLRKQKRIQVAGCAGSGKTLLAVNLAREHALIGKKVLFTCYNKNLAAHVKSAIGDIDNILVLNFHELVSQRCLEAKISYEVPEGPKKINNFFQNRCPELLLDANEADPPDFDTVIVDEAMDFQEIWWLAVESMGSKEFSFYLFFDQNQRIYREESADWSPPFASDPIVLDTNMRNTQQIGVTACQLGNLVDLPDFEITNGPEPVYISCTGFDDVVKKLSSTIQDITKKGQVLLEDIVVLSPYRLDNKKFPLLIMLSEHGFRVTTELVYKKDEAIRLGTIHSFKGLEADVVILAGIDGSSRVCAPQNLYVGASRARSMLYILHLPDFTP